MTVNFLLSFMLPTLEKECKLKSRFLKLNTNRYNKQAQNVKYFKYY